MKFFGGLVVGLFLCGMATTSMATPFVGSSTGTFENPTGGSVHTGVGTNFFTTGTGPSSLEFLGTAFSIDSGNMFQVGTLNYHNGTSNIGSSAGFVDLDVTLAFNGPSVFTEDFSYQLEIVNTPNSGNANFSADYVYLPSAYFSREGVDYTLTMQFGELLSGGGFTGIDSFHVFEGENATAALLGTITPTNTAAVPEPTTMLLLGTGLVGLAGIGRRKKK